MQQEYPPFDEAVIFWGYCVRVPTSTTLRKGGNKQRNEVKELGKSETYASTMTNTVNQKAAEVPDQRRHAIICVILAGSSRELNNYNAILVIYKDKCFADFSTSFRSNDID